MQHAVNVQLVLLIIMELVLLIIRKIFKSSFLTNLFGDINSIYFLQIESNLWHKNPKRHSFWDGGSMSDSSSSYSNDSEELDPAHVRTLTMQTLS